MPESQIIGYSNLAPGGGINNGVVRAVVPLNTLNVDGLASEEFPELPVREAGVFDRGYVRVESNTLDEFTTMSVRRSRSDPSPTISVTIGAAQTGAFEDMSNSVTFAASDELTWKVDTSPSTTGMFNAKSVSLRFTPTDTSVTTSWGYAGGSGGGLTANNVTRFMPISGTVDVQATESFAQGKIHGAFTSRNLVFQVASNARTTNTVVGTRINGANGNQSVTVGSTQTGVFEDTTNSDAISAADTYNYRITTLGGGGLINTRRVSTTLVSSARQWVYSAANINAALVLAVSGGVSAYVPFAGNLAQHTATEADAQVKAFAQTVSKLSVNVSANNASGAGAVATTTVRTRVAGSNGSVSVTINTSQTGVFEDLSNADSITADQLVNLQIHIATTGVTTGGVTFRGITLRGETAAPAAGGFRSRIAGGFVVAA